jgi:hypothetical protein
MHTHNTLLTKRQIGIKRQDFEGTGLGVVHLFVDDGRHVVSGRRTEVLTRGMSSEDDERRREMMHESFGSWEGDTWTGKKLSTIKFR